jgi:flagellar basal-body rod protein FlgB
MAAFDNVSVTRVLSDAMRAAELSHKYIANNIANVDTPRYSPKNIDFDKTLRAFIEGRGGIALRTDRPRHLEFTSYRSTSIRESYSASNDFNKVDLDEEMTKLSENTGRYNMYASLLTKHAQMTRNMLSALQR